MLHGIGQVILHGARHIFHFHNSPCEKVLKIEMDYSDMVRDLERMHYEQPVYICRDGEILLSNEGHNSRRFPAAVHTSPFLWLPRSWKTLRHLRSSRYQHTWSALYYPFPNWLYIFCVLFPLVVTDGVILYDLIRLERQRQQYEMENVAISAIYDRLVISIHGQLCIIHSQTALKQCILHAV